MHVDLAAADVDVAVAPDVPADVDLGARQLESVAAHGRGGGEDRVALGGDGQRGDRRLRRRRGRWIVVDGAVVEVVVDVDDVVGRQRRGRRRRGRWTWSRSWSWSVEVVAASSWWSFPAARSRRCWWRPVCRAHPVFRTWSPTCTSSPCRSCRPPDRAVRHSRRAPPAAGGTPSTSRDRPARGRRRGARSRRSCR